MINHDFRARKAAGRKPKAKPSGKRHKGAKGLDKLPKDRAQKRAGVDRKGTRSGLAFTKSQARAKKAPLDPSGPRTVTGKAVAKLRAGFTMSQAQFARLLGVSPSTVVNWEKSEGPLNLRASTRKAWDTVSKLRNREAWQRLSKS